MTAFIDGVATKVQTDCDQPNALGKWLERERRLEWFRSNYIRRKSEPSFMQRRRIKAREDDASNPQYRARIQEWERQNAERVRQYKAAWARNRRKQETPEEREVRRSAQRAKEHAYYHANKEERRAKENERRRRKSAERKAQRTTDVEKP